jgi:hypothetical protein
LRKLESREGNEKRRAKRDSPPFPREENILLFCRGTPYYGLFC